MLNTSLLFIVIAISLIGIIMTRSKSGENVTRLERKLDVLIKNAGIDLSTLADKEALALAKAGKKKEAIELYQDFTGLSPEAAQAAVDRLQKTA